MLRKMYVHGYNKLFVESENIHGFKKSMSMDLKRTIHVLPKRKNRKQDKKKELQKTERRKQRRKRKCS